MNLSFATVEDGKLTCADCGVAFEAPEDFVAHLEATLIGNICPTLKDITIKELDAAYEHVFNNRPPAHS